MQEQQLPPLPLFEQPKVIGLILDLSLRTINGRRIVDVVKKQLGAVLRAFNEEDTVLYLYHPDAIDTLGETGEQVGAIGNFETDGYMMDIPFALKQTCYIVAAQNSESGKHVFWVTDRFDASKTETIQRTFRMCRLDNNITVIGIGDHHQKELQEACHEERFIHLDDPAQLKDTVLSILRG